MIFLFHLLKDFFIQDDFRFNPWWVETIMAEQSSPSLQYHNNVFTQTAWLAIAVFLKDLSTGWPVPEFENNDYIRRVWRSFHFYWKDWGDTFPNRVIFFTMNGEREWYFSSLRVQVICIGGVWLAVCEGSRSRSWRDKTTSRAMWLNSEHTSTLSLLHRAPSNFAGIQPFLVCLETINDDLT